MKVLFEKKGLVAYVTINRPERRNACDGETSRRLTEVWGECRDDPALRVGILTGAGDRALCVGTDVKATSPPGSAQNPIIPLLPCCR
jgi:enoyl-CoA hydratase/carnithine racemase